MGDTREHKIVGGALEGEARRRYMRALLADLRALERMLEEGRFERDVARVGAEQEMFLVDPSYQAAPVALALLDRLGSAHYTTELGRFNLEMNADPQLLAGGGLARLERQLEELYARVREAADELGVQPVLAGILPTLGPTDLRIENMVPNPRYLTLNRVMTAARGESYDISIKGLDELVARHDSLMFEACNASFQVHLQSRDPSSFGRDYDVAQLLLAPVVASATNSPTLFGKRLWAETRIALFEQSCDIRAPSLHGREKSARVSFGTGWVEGSIVSLFRENVALFPPLVVTDRDEDSLTVLDRGGVPELRALRLHNGTIYRWNRACYGISENGQPHLRIELRALPAGPTIADEVATAAFWLGLMSELTATLEGLPRRMDFDHARSNFYAAARDGLAARFTWLDGEEVLAQPLILDRLLPIAEAGLARARVDEGDAKRYLRVVEERVRSLRSGSRWAIRSLAAMKPTGSAGERTTALVAAMIERQREGKPVAEWDDATVDEAYSKRHEHAQKYAQKYVKVSQYMHTDVLTVHPDDPIELAADLFAWREVRHLPVEDSRGVVVGLLTSRSPLSSSSRAAHSDDSLDAPPASSIARPTKPEPGTCIGDVMRREVVTVTPDTPVTRAISLMRQRRIGCLPVVEAGRLVGLLTEKDFVGVAAGWLSEEGDEADDGGADRRVAES